MPSEERSTRVEPHETNEVDEYGPFDRSDFERMMRCLRDQDSPIQQVTWRLARPDK